MRLRGALSPVLVTPLVRGESAKNAGMGAPPFFANSGFYYDECTPPDSECQACGSAERSMSIQQRLFVVEGRGVERRWSKRSTRRCCSPRVGTSELEWTAVGRRPPRAKGVACERISGPRKNPSSPRRCWQRKGEPERRSLPQHALQADLTLVSLDDGATDVEPQPQTDTRALLHLDSG